jgi:hypothetical protein
MHGHILESVQHAKYLGVTISTDLKWNTHIQQTAAKANKSLCFIRRNLKEQSQTIKERAYQTLIRPKLEYCCTVWDPHTKENINSLEKVQPGIHETDIITPAVVYDCYFRFLLMKHNDLFALAAVC